MFLLIPYKRLVIDTSLTPDQVTQLLSAEIRTKRFWDFNDGRFWGKLGSNSFTAWQSRLGQNSFTPVLYGKFDLAAEGTRIRVRLTLHPGIVVFLIVWSSPCSLLWIDYYLKGNPQLD